MVLLSLFLSLVAPARAVEILPCQLATVQPEGCYGNDDCFTVESYFHPDYGKSQYVLAIEEMGGCTSATVLNASGEVVSVIVPGKNGSFAVQAAIEPGATLWGVKNRDTTYLRLRVYKGDAIGATPYRTVDRGRKLLVVGGAYQEVDEDLRPLGPPKGKLRRTDIVFTKQVKTKVTRINATTSS